MCSPDVELIAIGLRPYYLPWEFTNVIAITVYILPTSKVNTACDVIHSVMADLQTKHPRAFILITGKSDHNLVLPSPSYTPVVQQQSVTVRTVMKWSDGAMDCLRDALETTNWSALCEPHGEDLDGLAGCVSDYIKFCTENSVPTKKSEVTKINLESVCNYAKTMSDSVAFSGPLPNLASDEMFSRMSSLRRWLSRWCPKNQERRCPSHTTDWDMFKGATHDLDEYTDTVTSYIHFCEERILPTRTRVSYSNDKPWFTPKLRQIRKEKEAALKSGDRDCYREAKYRFSKELRRAKSVYSEKLQQQFTANDSASVWRGLRQITDYRPQASKGQDDKALCQSLSLHYARFDTSSAMPNTSPPPSVSAPMDLTPSKAVPSSSPPPLTISPPPITYHQFPPPPPLHSPSEGGGSTGVLVRTQQPAAERSENSGDDCGLKVTAPLPPLALMDSPITITDSFRFLGTTITRDLKWEPTISSLIKKAQQRMFFLRKLRKLKLPPRMLAQFYTAIIESILTSSITVWFAGATARDRLRLQRVVRAAEKVIGCRLPSIQDLYISRTRRCAGRITADPSHPGHGLFSPLPSGRRLRSIRTRTSCYTNSFFPSAIRLLNTK
ncbi:hypothetical protein D4764_20G0009620 [Takifugu flavidus]|uniref:Alkylated DNA repair protein AlkB homologue 8 N-terminal domain-containing protein n=1 Tax=Takifugu flavidus TaxID=433684 RepID=A0A5C6NLE7_9TELE|nr:hypothetical protein D4764_20G0009620 [Takifugu flavidus]